MFEYSLRICPMHWDSHADVGGNIMKHEMQKNDLIQKFRIKEQINTSFGTILKENTAEDLDIENKNVSINSRNIEY